MPLESWPRIANVERARLVLESVRAGRYELKWCPIDIEDLRVLVSCDALKIDGVRVTADAKTQQLIADELGAVLLTPKLYDQIYLKTESQNRLTPHPLGEPRTSTARMVEHSGLVDREIAQKGSSGLIANQGKAWVIVKAIFTEAARKARRAANYGWISSSGESSQSTPSLRVIQDIGTAHSTDYDSDYSQVILLALRTARYGELPVDLANVYTGDAPGNELVSHEGPLPNFRQPGVDEPPPAVPPAGGSSSRKTAKTALGGAAAGALALAAGAGPLGIAASVLIGSILGRRV
jgi:hypothetical protein